MAKIPKSYIEGALFYVISRGDHSENIFLDEADYGSYLSLLKKYKQQYGFKIFSFVLMPNELHLLFELKEGLTISEIMHDLSANYTKVFNAKYKRKGHLFQERTKMAVLEKERYLLPVGAYIHALPELLNPAAPVKDYPYGSYAVFCGARSFPGLDLKEEMRQVSEVFLSGRTYEDFFAGFSQEQKKALAEELRKKSILGSQGFIENINKEMQGRLAASVVRSGKGLDLKSRNFILAVSGAIFFLLAVSFVFLNVNRSLESKLDNLSREKDKEYSQRLHEERQNIKKDLSELYRADQVSAEAMAKRLEIEKQRVRSLEEKVGQNK
jgi:REP element-mobilizing transposase RayT